MEMKQTKPTNVYYSYAEEDAELRIKLEKHLSTLRRGFAQ